MSHYYYDPLNGRFKSNAFVNLSLEEMRHEYYQEVEENRRNSSNKREPSVINSDYNLRKRKKITTRYETMKENSPINRNLTNIIDNQNNKRTKRNCESDSDETINFKKIKINDSFSSRYSRSIDDEVDFISKTIINSGRKSKLHKKRKSCLQKSAKNALEIDKNRVKTIVDLRKIGNELVKSGDYSAAFDRYTESLNMSCSKFPLLTSLCYSNRAFSLMKLGKYSDALVDCDLAIQYNPDCDEKTKLRQIKCLIELERFAEARTDVMKLTTDNNNSNNSECGRLLEIIIDKQKYSDFIDAAKRWESNGNCENAVLSYSEAIEVDNNSANVFFDRARCLYKLGRFRETLNDLNEALRLDPLNSKPIYNRIGCLIKLERFQDAIREADNLNRSHPCQEHQDLLRTAIYADKMASKRNYYEILNVDRTASVAEIRKQYRKMALLYHPDKITDADSRSKVENEEKFKQLTVIFNTLSNVISRNVYDMGLPR